jgi:hypothetical protein
MSERVSKKRHRESTVRICDRPDCKTKLSIYNKQAVCAPCSEKDGPSRE